MFVVVLSAAFSVNRVALAEYKPSLYPSVEAAFNDFSDYETDDGTLRILSKNPLHIQLSPQVLKNDRKDVIRVLNRKALLYGIYRTFIHTKADAVKVTALPMDHLTKDHLKEFKETVQITRDKALKTAAKVLGVKSLNELVTDETPVGKIPDSWARVFENGYTETGKPGIHAFIDELMKK